MQEIIVIFYKVIRPRRQKTPRNAIAVDAVHYVCVSNADAVGWCSERANIQGGA